MGLPLTSNVSRTPSASAIWTIKPFFINCEAISNAPGNKPPESSRKSRTNELAPFSAKSVNASFVFAADNELNVCNFTTPTELSSLFDLHKSDFTGTTAYCFLVTLKLFVLPGVALGSIFNKTSEPCGPLNNSATSYSDKPVTSVASISKILSSGLIPAKYAGASIVGVTTFTLKSESMVNSTPMPLTFAFIVFSLTAAY
mmetsp:Transcript_1231/g.3639  ORF Transcript_1231/g.3639 Transcript_1231/m.3639 type:complete len:200 (+) Transcript_1231:442-1041(+)